jgi:hypothetical protein
VLHSWRDWAVQLPKQATTSAAILRLPAMPGVPAPLADKTTLAIRYAWVGDTTAGAKAFAPIAQAAVPVLGGVSALPYAAIGGIHADPVEPMPVREHSLLLTELPAAAVDALLTAAGPDAPSPQLIVELRLLGGAISRPPAVDSAVDHRDAAFSLLLIGIAAPPVLPATIEHGASTLAALTPWSTGAVQANFGSADDRALISAKYRPETLARLGELVRRYDPAEVLAGADAIRAATGDRPHSPAELIAIALGTSHG